MLQGALVVNRMLKILSGVIVCSATSVSFAALPSTATSTVGPEHASGQLLAFDPQTGESCSMGALKSTRLNGAAFVQDANAKQYAKQVVSQVGQQAAIPGCSASVRAEVEHVSASVQTGTRTALAPIIWGGMVYYAVCSAINVQAMTESLRSTMAFGGNGEYTVAGVLSATVCIPVTGTNLVLTYLFFQGAEKWDEMNKKPADTAK